MLTAPQEVLIVSDPRLSSPRMRTGMNMPLYLGMNDDQLLYRLLTASFDTRRCDCKYCSSAKTEHSPKNKPLEENEVERPSQPSRQEPVPDTSPVSTSVEPSSEHPFEPTPAPFPPLPHYTTLRRTPLRPGELVWVPIEPPILDPSAAASDFKISWWPAIIASSSLSDPTNIHTIATSEVRLVVLMLGTRTQYRLPSSEVVPYHAYAPHPRSMESYELVVRNQVAANERSFQSMARPSDFVPLPHPLPSSDTDGATTHHPSDSVDRFRDSVWPFLLGVAAARYLASAWHLPGCLILPRARHTTTLQRVETAYDQLWWGPECIRLGDIVRLKHRRAELPSPFESPAASAEETCVLLSVESISAGRIEGGNVPTLPTIGGVVFEVIRWPSSRPSHSTPPSLLDRPHPDGYRLRSLLPLPRQHAYFDVKGIAGRYYPDLPLSPAFPRLCQSLQEHGPTAHPIPSRLRSVIGILGGEGNATQTCRCDSRERAGEVSRDAVAFGAAFWKRRIDSALINGSCNS